MSASDRTITRALSDLNFARADLKAAAKMDAVQRKTFVDELNEFFGSIPDEFRGNAFAEFDYIDGGERGGDGSNTAELYWTRPETDEEVTARLDAARESLARSSRDNEARERAYLADLKAKYEGKP